MSRLIACPSCQSRLRVPEGDSALSYTCPRCLAEVRPAATTDTVPAQALEATSERPAERAPDASPPCRWCDTPITSREWRYCPGCAAPLRGGPTPRTHPATLDDDFRRDRQRSGGFTIAMMVLGVVALVLGGMAALSTGDPGAVMAGLFVVGIVTACVWGVVYARTRGRPEELTAGRVARGVAVTVGSLVFGYIVLMLGVGLFLLAVCASTGFR